MNILNKKNLIWIDLEMTGLNPEKDKIIEIATIITNKYLEILEKGPTIAIYQSKKQLSLMDNWNKKIHNETGLINRVENSQYNEQKAEQKTINFLKKWVPKGFSPICGNSIAQDRRFLFKYMPKLEKYFHYRYIDVSTLKGLVRLWKPELLKKFSKKNTHQALIDVEYSIKELIFYKNNFIQIK
ncbi:MAG: oligoribonuclease [Arsenophonus sp.]|nr:MAG: oligoribonuclease [Arsenophonus sp.]